MIIEISNATYRKGYGQRLDSVSMPGLMAKLDAIMEWDHCLFPPKTKEGTKDEWEENREFLGTEPELKVGTTFKFGNQLLAIEDENTLVMVLSETGIGGLQRVWKEKIIPEINIVFNNTSPEELEVEKAEADEIPESWEIKKLPYEVMKLLRDRMIPGREDFFGHPLCAKITLMSSVIPIPIYLYLQDWGFRYDPNEVEEDELNLIEEELVSGLYNKYSRIKLSNEDPYEKRNQAVKQAKENANAIMEGIKKTLENGGEEEEEDSSADTSGIPFPQPTRYSDIFSGSDDEDDEDETIEEYTGPLYYKVYSGNISGSGKKETVLDLSDLSNVLEDSDYEKFGVKFERDFPEYRVCELAEGVFEVCDVNTWNYADPTILENKLKNHSDYQPGLW